MKKRYVLVSVMFALLLIFASCGKNSDSGSEAAKGCISGSDLSAAFKTIDEYKGYDVIMIVKVFGVETDESGVYFQGFQDYLNYENNVVVAYTGDVEIKEDDYVKIKGNIMGKFEGENVVGGKVTAMQVKAETIEKMSYKDIFAPTLKEVEVNQTKNQKGYSVTIEKIEFAQKETRIYVKMANNGKSEFNLYKFNAKIKQGKKQYETQDNYDADYEELPSDLIPDTEASGIIVFPAIDQKDFILILKASSDNYSEDIKDYKYTISVS